MSTPPLVLVNTCCDVSVPTLTSVGVGTLTHARQHQQHAARYSQWRRRHRRMELTKHLFCPRHPAPQHGNVATTQTTLHSLILLPHNINIT